MQSQPRNRDLAKTVCAHRRAEPVAAIVAADLDELRDRVAKALAGLDEAGVRLRRPLAGKVAILFPGQGSQRPGMLADLFVAFPQLHGWLEQGAPDFKGKKFQSQLRTLKSSPDPNHDEIVKLEKAQNRWLYFTFIYPVKP